MVGGLLAFSRAVDTINRGIGKALCWLIVVAVFLSTANAVVRKLFDLSSNAWLELQWVLFSIVFLMCASWTSWFMRRYVLKRSLGIVARVSNG